MRNISLLSTDAAKLGQSHGNGAIFVDIIGFVVYNRGAWRGKA
jgi:hypothetical protein